MKPTKILSMVSAALLALPVIADDEDHLAHAAFGRGLNTAAPGNAVNHVVIPDEIEINVGGVVDFTVAGFHSIVIFKPGFAKRDLDALLGAGSLPLAGFFIVPPDPAEAFPAGFEFLEDQIYYRGINPVPPGAVGAVANVFNRPEPVAFLEQGKYFVICNVLPHYEDGMFAYVEVEESDDDDDDDDD